MTTSAIKLTSPHELLAVVPYLLGFNPTNSIVTLCLSDNRIGLTQRLDLPRPEDADLVGSALLPSLSNENPDAVISEFVGRGISPHPDRAALAVQVEAGPQATEVARVMRVTADGC